jgi:hypothetical protein
MKLTPVRKAAIALQIAAAAVFFFLGCAANAQVPGFTATEVQTLGDLNFIARAKVNHTGPIKDRLYAMALALKGQNGGVLAWKGQDPDPGQALGYIADTDPDGHDPVNRALIDRLASYLGVAVKPVIWPSAPPTAPPAPVVVLPPSTPPVSQPATTAGAIEAAVQALIDAKLAGLQAQVSGLAARLAVAESAGGSGSSGGASGTSVTAADQTGGGHSATLGAGAVELRANTLHAKTQQDITDEYCGIIQMNGWDGGLRLHQNYNWKCSEQLPFAVWGGDSHAAWSYQQGPAKAAMAGKPANFLYGQSLVIDGGHSQLGYDYATGAPLARGILFAAQRNAEPMLFAVTPRREVGEYPSNRVVLRLNSDGSQNPAEVVIDGALRRLKSCNVGGVTVVCF